MRFPCKRGETRTGCQRNFRHDALLNSPNQLLLSYQIYLITLVPVLPWRPCTGRFVGACS
jgi:hypothetical protein